MFPSERSSVDKPTLFSSSALLPLLLWIEGFIFSPSLMMNCPHGISCPEICGFASVGLKVSASVSSTLLKNSSRISDFGEFRSFCFVKAANFASHFGLGEDLFSSGDFLNWAFGGDCPLLVGGGNVRVGDGIVELESSTLGGEGKIRNGLYTS